MAFGRAARRTGGVVFRGIGEDFELAQDVDGQDLSGGSS
jgi:hypothetical protein